MKSITLHIDDAVFHALDDSIRKKRYEGTFNNKSATDMLCLALIESLKAGQKERTLRFRRSESVINAVGK